ETLASYELGKTVDWKGAVPFTEVRNFYATHDAFFFASLRDSSPAQLIEAMAFGLPVVTINLHGQAMMISDETGIRCACDTPEIAIAELKKAILYLYNHPEKVNEMSSAAYKHASQQNWTNKINKITHQFYNA
ncbi:MAG: glycosyltransferase family 4 protein, partial [Bacteroidota bacterium]